MILHKNAYAILWDIAIWLTNNLIFSDNFQKIRFYIRLSSKIPKNMKKDARRPQKWENRAPGCPKVSPRAPKVSQRVPKVSQKGAKGSQKWTKGEPRGGKSEPKVSQIQHKINIKNRIAKRELKRSPHRDSPGPFWEPFSIKIRWKNRCENRWRKSDENWWKIDTKIYIHFHIFRNIRS